MFSLSGFKIFIVLVILALIFPHVGVDDEVLTTVSHNHESGEDNLDEYNHTLAIILVHYDDSIYESDLTEPFTWTFSRCGGITKIYESDLTVLFTWTFSRCGGITKGFELISLIIDVHHCLQAYVGVAKDPTAIIGAFRGTKEQSIQNWVEDVYWIQLDLNYPDMPEAMVHHGFYNAYHNTTLCPGVVDGVKRAMDLVGDIEVIVGHSMGGAMAGCWALNLTVVVEPYSFDYSTVTRIILVMEYL